MKHTRNGHLALILVVGACSGACNKDDATSPSGAPPPLPAGPAGTVGAGPAGSPVALGGFEGEVGLAATSKAKHLVFALQVKGPKLRLDLPEGIEGVPRLGNVHVVMNAPAKQLFAVMDDRQQVVSVNLATVGDQLKGLKPPTATPEPTHEAPAKVTKTGHHDRVAGRACEDWEIADPKGQKVRICVADEGASWFTFPTMGLPAQHAWASELMDGRHFPLRVISFETDGSESGRLELTKLEPKPIPDSVFEIPAAYKVLDVAGMMQSLMAGAMSGMVRPGEPPGPGAAAGQHKMPPNMEAMIRQMQERAKARNAKPR